MERWQQDAALSREHARWLEPDDPKERTYRCMECGYESDEDDDPCPECGGDMCEIEDDMEED